MLIEVMNVMCLKFGLVFLCEGVLKKIYDVDVLCCDEVKVVEMVVLVEKIVVRKC